MEAAMRFGICNWVFGAEPLQATLRRLARYGYDGIELAAEPGKYDLDGVRRMVADHGLRVLGMTSQAGWPTETRDLTHPDPAQRARGVDYGKACVEMAAELGAPYAAVLPTPAGRFFGLASYEEEWGWAVEGVRAVGEYAQAAGVTLVVEVLNRYEAFLLHRAAQGLRFLAEVDCGAVRLLLDAFHMHLEEADLHAALRQARDALGALHLADTNRQGLGRGHLDLGALFRTLRAIDYEGTICLEFTAPGPHPFHAIKDEGSPAYLDVFARESIALLRGMAQVGVAG
jgi:sugar phosphate isomerase/epimerase